MYILPSLNTTEANICDIEQLHRIGPYHPRFMVALHGENDVLPGLQPPFGEAAAPLQERDDEMRQIAQDRAQAIRAQADGIDPFIRPKSARDRRVYPRWVAPDRPQPVAPPVLPLNPLEGFEQMPVPPHLRYHGALSQPKSVGGMPLQNGLLPFGRLSNDPSNVMATPGNLMRFKIAEHLLEQSRPTVAVRQGQGPVSAERPNQNPPIGAPAPHLRDEHGRMRPNIKEPRQMQVGRLPNRLAHLPPENARQSPAPAMGAKPKLGIFKVPLRQGSAPHKDIAMPDTILDKAARLDNPSPTQRNRILGPRAREVRSFSDAERNAYVAGYGTEQARKALEVKYPDIESAKPEPDVVELGGRMGVLRQAHGASQPVVESGMQNAQIESSTSQNIEPRIAAAPSQTRGQYARAMRGHIETLMSQRPFQAKQGPQDEQAQHAPTLLEERKGFDFGTFGKTMAPMLAPELAQREISNRAARRAEPQKGSFWGGLRHCPLPPADVNKLMGTPNNGDGASRLQQPAIVQPSGEQHNGMEKSRESEAIDIPVNGQNGNMSVAPYVAKPNKETVRRAYRHGLLKPRDFYELQRDLDRNLEEELLANDEGPRNIGGENLPDMRAALKNHDLKRLREVERTYLAARLQEEALARAIRARENGERGLREQQLNLNMRAYIQRSLKRNREQANIRAEQAVDDHGAVEVIQALDRINDQPPVQGGREQDADFDHSMDDDSSEYMMEGSEVDEDDAEEEPEGEL